MRVSQPTAFTLIELLAVIAVIGILAAILIPALGAVKESSHSAKCVSNLRQITTVSLMFANENQGRLPTQGWQPGISGYYWFEKVAPLLGARERFNGFQADREIEVYRCPSALALHSPGTTPTNSQIRTYSINAVLNNIDSYTDSDDNLIVPGMPLNKAFDPAKTAFFMDGYYASAHPYWGQIADYAGMMKKVEDSFVHSGTSINVSFLDGHVASVTSENLPEPGNIFWDPLAD